MGRAKALMMEMEEAQWEESEAEFYCPDCKDQVEGSVELPVVFDNGDIKQLPVSVLCCVCNTSFAGWVDTDWDRCEIELDDYPEIEIKAAPARRSVDEYNDDYDQDYFEWLEKQERISRPVYQAFSQTMSEVKALTAHVLLDQQSQMLARMLLAQSITALEVFLADTLILTVANNKGAQSRLLRSKELAIGSIQFKLADAIDIEDFSKTKLLEHLHAISFHNLKKVNGLFRVGLGIDVLPEGEEIDRIRRAIKMRHDCVHRNGVDRETGEVHQIEQATLFCLTETLLHMVKSADEKVEIYEAPF